MQCTRSVRHRNDQTHAVMPGGRRCRHLFGQAHDGEPRAVEGVVLDRVGGDVQAEFGCRPVARNADPGRVGRGEPRPFGIAGGGAALDVGQMGVEPALALGQRLRVRVDGLDADQRIRLAQQVVPYQQAGFPHDLQRCREEQVERAGDHAFGGVFDRHHAEFGAARCRGPKYLVDAAAGYPFDAGAEVLKSGLFTEGPRRAEKRHPLRCFERPAGRHHLAPDMGYTSVIYRAGIAGLQAPDNLRFALWPKYRRAIQALDMPDFIGKCRALVQQLEQLRVDRVDLLS